MYDFKYCHLLGLAFSVAGAANDVYCALTIAQCCVQVGVCNWFSPRTESVPPSTSHCSEGKWYGIVLFQLCAERASFRSFALAFLSIIQQLVYSCEFVTLIAYRMPFWWNFVVRSFFFPGTFARVRVGLGNKQCSFSSCGAWQRFQAILAIYCFFNVRCIVFAQRFARSMGTAFQRIRVDTTSE